MTDNEDLKREQSKKDDDIIADCVAFVEMCDENDSDNRRAAVDDLKFLSGKQWPSDVAALREIEKRPCLTINKLLTFVHQVTNQQRQNKPSIKVHPVDSRSDPKTAEVLQGLIRYVEYNSNADTCYDTAVNSAAAIGFGYFGLLPDYEDANSFDQCIKFRRIRNPLSVRFDPASTQADGSDALKVVIETTMTRAQFGREFPGHEISQDSLIGSRVRPNWINDSEVKVCEFFRVEFESVNLVLLSNGQVADASDFTEQDAALSGLSVVKKRTAQRRTVMWYKLNALEVLERTEVPCEWIPVFPVYGDEIDIEGKVVRSGLVRHAKDPAQMYNLWMTAATEEVALRPKTPFIGAEGQFENHEQKWAQANKRSFPYLEYTPLTVDGLLVPAPQRQPMADVPSGMLAMAMHASDNIKSTTGLFDSSLGARGTATSGVQERSQQMQGDVANFHYSDGLIRAIRHAGRCLIQMIQRTYDTTRMVRVIGEDETASHAEINSPLPVPEQGQDGTIKTIKNDLSVGKYDITVSAGPSYSTMRMEAQDAMVAFGKTWPKLMDVAGDKVIRAMDWPGATEIADRVAKTIPPELRDDPEKEGQEPPIPPQVMMALEQMKQQNDMLHQALQEAESGITKAKMDAEASIHKAQVDAQSREEVARITAESRENAEELKGMVQLLIANQAPPPALAQEVSQDMSQNKIEEHPMIQQLQAQLAQVMQSMNEPRSQPVINVHVPKRGKRTIRTSRGQDGNLIAEMDEE